MEEYNNQLFTDEEINIAAEQHSKPLGGNEWTHNNSFIAGANFVRDNIQSTGYSEEQMRKCFNESRIKVRNPANDVVGYNGIQGKKSWKHKSFDEFIQLLPKNNLGEIAKQLLKWTKY